MRGMSRRKGITLVETLVVIAIIAVIAAILVPALSSAKRSSQISSSVSRLRQASLALNMYRTDAEGTDVFSTAANYYQLGLPPFEYWFTTRFHLPDNFWLSPCGFDPVLYHSAPNNFPGAISFVSPFYEPSMLRPGTGNLIEYGDYLPTYRENAVTFIDCYCNPAGTSMRDVLSKKRGLAVTLSGQLFNRLRPGNGFLLQFYSDPPTN